MKTITLDQILTWLSYLVTGASIMRLALHWLRGFPFLLGVLPYDEKHPSKFWIVFGWFEESAAYIAISLGKYARKGSGDLIIIPETKEAIDHKLTTLGTDDVTTQPWEDKE